MARTNEKYDFTGQTIGCYYVHERLPGDKNGFALWRCTCTTCGKEKDNVRSSSLAGAFSTSKYCGKSCESFSKASEEIGNRYHNLIVTEVSLNKSQASGTIYVNTICTCGKARDNVKLTDLRCKSERKWACSKACEATESSKDLIGQRFGSLTITGVSHGKKDDTKYDKNRVLLSAKCDCGKIINYPKRLFTGENGHRTLKSCGCEKVQRMKAICEQKWDGHTAIPQARATSEYFTWRKSVYKKYDGKCVLCGVKNKTGMESHHIFGFSFYKNLKYDVNNGILFCTECHKDFHRQNGNHYNNLDQLQVFMGTNEIPGIDVDKLAKDAASDILPEVIEIEPEAGAIVKE